MGPRCLAAVLLLLPALARAERPAEHDVKAALLYNVLKFVEWPEGSAGAVAAELTVCVAASELMAGALDPLAGRLVGSRTVKIRRVSDGADPAGCAAFFLGSIPAARVEKLARSLAEQSVLTFADSEGWAVKGVMVNFYLEEERVRFEISQAAAAIGKIRFSSKLLKLARLADTHPRGAP